MSKQTAVSSLKVIARSPFHLYFDGHARMVSGANKVGKFDVLPGHADFFSVMTPGEVVIDADPEAIAFDITNGIISVRDNEVLLFVNM
jgi:F0F1-type ATP synthase epsilon subunit